MKIASKFGHFFRNAKQTIFPLMLCLGLLATFAAVETSAQNRKPYATFQRLWIDYNVTEGGQQGMRVHTAFTTYNMKGIPAYLTLHFQQRDGTALRDINGKFTSQTGLVAAYRELNPGYNPAEFEDEAIFMPYDELDLEPGNYELRIDASIIYKQGGLVTRLTYHNFDYNDATSTKKPSATYDRIWADYNVKRNGLIGMVVHIKADVLDMKGKTGYIAFYFQKKSGTKLLTTNPTYRSDDINREGQVVSYFAITPGFDETTYEDASIFMPYDEFNLPRGSYELQIDVDLIDKDGELLQHMALHDFSYEK